MDKTVKKLAMTEVLDC